MARYLFIYRSTPPASEPSPEEMQAIMTAWGSWIEAGMKAGWMVDPGNPLDYDGKVVESAGTVTDGPFAESKELVGGYSFVVADSLDEAVKLTAGCPALATGRVEVRQVVELDLG